MYRFNADLGPRDRDIGGGRTVRCPPRPWRQAGADRGLEGGAKTHGQATSEGTGPPPSDAGLEVASAGRHFDHAASPLSRPDGGPLLSRSQLVGIRQRYRRRHPGDV